ncbi:MAG: hypothetical protein Q9164_001619 [Protoblastenia rupestris]
MSEPRLSRYWERIERNYKYQFYQWFHVNQIGGLKVITGRFNDLFEEIYQATGTRDRMDSQDWAGRKRVWDKEWDIGGKGLSMAAVEELELLPLWYDGEEKLLKMTPYTATREPKYQTLNPQGSSPMLTVKGP